MVKYLIFLYEQEAIDFVNQINTCMGYPKNGTITYYNSPDVMCEYDSMTGDSLQIGYGILIKDFIIDCLTQEQKGDIIILPDNMNCCNAFSGQTIN